MDLMKKLGILTYKATIRFHGHNGPFLALGYKLGIFLVKKLRPKGIMDFRITVITKIEKPYTCLIDGLQCSTHATIGKGNLLVKRNRGRKAKVIVEKEKKIYQYQITDEAINICSTAENLDEAARRVFLIPINRLYKITC